MGRPTSSTLAVAPFSSLSAPSHPGLPRLLLSGLALFLMLPTGIRHTLLQVEDDGLVRLAVGAGDLVFLAGVPLRHDRPDGLHQLAVLVQHRQRALLVLLLGEGDLLRVLLGGHLDGQLLGAAVLLFLYQKTPMIYPKNQVPYGLLLK